MTDRPRSLYSNRLEAPPFGSVTREVKSPGVPAVPHEYVNAHPMGYVIPVGRIVFDDPSAYVYWTFGVVLTITAPVRDWDSEVTWPNPLYDGTTSFSTAPEPTVELSCDVIRDRRGDFGVIGILLPYLADTHNGDMGTGE